MSFDVFGLTDRLLQGIALAEYTSPTPIQEAAIPTIIEGKDLIGCAQTGTGKTAAFVIPLLQNLHNSAPEYQQPGKLKNGGFRPIRALILSPTRELAQQIEQATSLLSRFMRIRPFCIYGGVSIEMQEKQLGYSTDIVIATPGRLLDLLNRKALDFSKLEILVLDEADKMLDMGFINDVKKIVAQTPPMRQTLMFSATMSEKIQALTRQVQRSPEVISIGERRNPAETIAQHFYSIPQANKVDLLLHVLKEEEMESVIVFSRTKHGADRIMKRLARQGFASAAIHSNRTQSQRQSALAGFKSGKIKVLVATDIAARGIDVDGVSHVINFDTPPDAEDYIHRIGRTGRANTTGDALSFVSRDEFQYIRKIERHIGKRLAVKPYPGFVMTKVEQDEHHDEPDEQEVSHGENRHRDGHQNGYHKKTDFRRKHSGSRAEKQGFTVLSQPSEAGTSRGDSRKELRSYTSSDKSNFSKSRSSSSQNASKPGGDKGFGFGKGNQKMRNSAPSKAH